MVLILGTPIGAWDMEQRRKLGRNEPCWCGSGKKYKNCHLREDEAAALRELRKSRLIQQLDEFALQRRFETDLRSAAKFFYGDEALPAHDQQAEEAYWQRALDYFIFDYPLPNEQRVIERFMAEQGKRLSPDERALLDAWAHAHLAPYEVIELRPGEGMRLRDLISGEEVDVREKRGTEQVSRWDVIFTRVLRMEDHYELNAAGLFVPVRFRDWLRGYAEGLWSDYELRHPEKSYEDFAHASSQLLNQFILDEIEPALNRPPTLVTAEGDLMEQCTATYAVLDHTLALARLRAAEEFAEEGEAEAEEKSFAWHETGESPDLLRAHGPDYEYHEAVGGEHGGTRILGHLELGVEELELQTTSRRRLSAGKELLEQRLGATIQHRGDAFESIEELLARAPDQEEEEQESVEAETAMSEELEEWQTELAAREHLKWLDRKVPALEDQTPREAVQSLGGRVRVIRLLKEFESIEANRARHGQIPFDVNELKRALGLTDQEFVEESRLEDLLKEKLDTIAELTFEDRVDEALAQWHALLATYSIRSLDDLDFAEVWELSDIATEAIETLSYRLAMFKRFDQAIALLEEYARLDTDEADHWRAHIAVLRAERGETAQALRELEELATHEGAEFDALSNWAQVEGALLHHPDRALELWRRADEYADEYQGGAAYEAVLQIYLDERRLDEAEQFWHEVNDAESEAERDYVSWVWIMLARGDLQRAREGAERISNQAPRDYWTGIVEARAGNFDQARKLWKDDLLTPQFDEWGFWALWAELHLRLHEPKPVLDKIDPIHKQKRAGAYWAVALAHALQGDLPQTAEWAERARGAMEARERRLNWASTLSHTRELAEALELSDAARQALGV
jgi:SEC-C motif